MLQSSRSVQKSELLRNQPEHYTPRTASDRYFRFRGSQHESFQGLRHAILIIAARDEICAVQHLRATAGLSALLTAPTINV